MRPTRLRGAGRLLAAAVAVALLAMHAPTAQPPAAPVPSGLSAVVAVSAGAAAAHTPAGPSAPSCGGECPAGCAPAEANCVSGPTTPDTPVVPSAHDPAAQHGPRFLPVEVPAGRTAGAPSLLALSISRT